MSLPDWGAHASKHWHSSPRNLNFLSRVNARRQIATIKLSPLLYQQLQSVYLPRY
jgi:hypothetical protein